MWGVLGNRLIGPFVFHSNLMGNAYEAFLRNELPGWLEDIPLMVGRQMYFQHDGAPPHYTRHVREYLNKYGYFISTSVCASVNCTVFNILTDITYIIHTECWVVACVVSNFARESAVYIRIQRYVLFWIWIDLYSWLSIKSRGLSTSESNLRNWTQCLLVWWYKQTQVRALNMGLPDRVSLSVCCLLTSNFLLIAGDWCMPCLLQLTQCCQGTSLICSARTLYINTSFS